MIGKVLRFLKRKFHFVFKRKFQFVMIGKISCPTCGLSTEAVNRFKGNCEDSSIGYLDVL